MDYYKNSKEGCSVFVETGQNLELELISKGLGNYLNEIYDLKEYLFLEKKGFVQEFGRGIVGDVIRSSCRNIRYSDLAKVFSMIMSVVEKIKYKCFSVPVTIFFSSEYGNRNIDAFHIFILDTLKLPQNIDPVFSGRNKIQFLEMVQRGDGVCMPNLYYGFNDLFLMKNIDCFTFSISWSDEVNFVGRFAYLKDFLCMFVSRQYLQKKLLNKEEVQDLAEEFIMHITKKEKVIRK
ncbi:MAG: hypothetical protein HFJ38_03410 [Bacilli bacterium]|nr:hypothetical protein [Bacilli bacterium]